MRRSSCPSVKRAKLRQDSNRDSFSQNDERVKAFDSSRVDEKPKKIETDSSCVDREPKNISGNQKSLLDSTGEQTPKKNAKRPIGNLEGEIVEDSFPSSSPSCNDHLSTIEDLEARNADKISELKLMLRTTESAETLTNGSLSGDGLSRLDFGRGERRPSRGIDDSDESTDTNDGKQEEEERRDRLLRELNGWEEAEKTLDEEITQSKKSRDDVHIEKLHEYNDLKDACQTVFGRLAELEEVTVGDIYKRYDVNVDD